MPGEISRQYEGPTAATVPSWYDEPSKSTMELQKETEYLKLFAILDKADEPSREIDAEIYCFAYRPCYQDETPEQRLDYARRCAPSYTASVDAALTLLRKHYLWELKQGIECRAIVWWLEKDWDDTGAPTAYSTTHPALALTKAALLARAVEDRVSVAFNDRG
jgi:hypothetical protein